MSDLGQDSDRSDAVAVTVSFAFLIHSKSDTRRQKRWLITIVTANRR